MVSQYFEEQKFYRKLFTDFVESLENRGFVTEEQVDNYLFNLHHDGIPVPFDDLCADLEKNKKILPDKDLDILNKIYKYLDGFSFEYDSYMKMLKESNK